MADVGDLSLGGNAPNDPFHRADEAILIAKIGGQRDDRHAFKINIWGGNRQGN
jgi:hypothetical protein